MKAIFLSHLPHESHLAFANSVNARTLDLKINWYVTGAKKILFLGHFYPIIAFIYSLFINVDGDVILVDGGSSLIIAYFLKIMNKNVKIIYIDDDLYFYNIKTKLGKKINSIFYNKIDAVISVSKQNMQKTLEYINKPIMVCEPFPKDVRKVKIKRKNYGLYVGRLDLDKNIKGIITFAIQCPYFEKFIIIGNGSHVDYVKKICRKNKKIVYLGEKDNLSDYYSECKFLIHLPDFEPYGCTPLEATLCNCYPIVSKGVGSKYLFNNLFIVNNSNDFREINKKVKYILDNEKYAYSLLRLARSKIKLKKKSVDTFKSCYNLLVLKSVV